MIDIHHALQEMALIASSQGGKNSEVTILAPHEVCYQPGNALVQGNMQVDVTEIEIDDDNEKYRIVLQGSDTQDFDEFEDLAILELGAAAVLGGDVDSTPGRYLVPFRNERNGVVYPFLRVYIYVSGTVTSGIRLSVNLVK